MSFLRTFVAVDVEDPLLLSALERTKSSLLSSGAPMKPVEQQNMHFTLRFIGEVPQSLVAEISRALATLEFKKFSIELRGLGAFPSTLDPRVIWVGVGKGAEEMTALRERVERLLRSAGVPAEREKFVPHLTLARMKGRPSPALVKMLQELSDLELGSMVVDSVRLKKSTLTRKGPIYETIFEVKAR
ncbi:MAG: RNA 2',3'-cyclic phosphodiesterase [Acidilobaceae archaeon]|nr:RNA 2',3'-cyclic phosphodiesterase [Acidilobaceae archaeon]MCX8165021.1 RNA 2',3'-cyclic phosphodiesterase [Acidilobaceae archaeon]MDW7974462.1 RNA 2',3'-cyclic phosphodiesterase [Sulfolobales archaeon]